MSENNNDLDEVFEEEMDDAEVITVPIDDTLSNSGEAADAKAVGDALALKADKTELQTAITVNGQAADAQGAIIVNSDEIKIDDDDATTVKAKLNAIDGKTGADIPVDNTQGAQTIKQALQSGATRTADQIEMSASDTTTVKQAIESVAGDLSDLAEDVAELDEKTAADIPYQTGSQETIKQHVDALDVGLVKTVYGEGPDENGDISPKYVPLADNLYVEDAQQIDASFLQRTTAGVGHVSTGNAWVQKLKGNSVHNGYVAESIQKTVTPMPRTAPAAITASIDNATFEAAAETAGTYEFNYTTSWDVSPTTYGITVSNAPINGDKITVVWDGEADPVMTVSAAERTAPPAITAVVDRDTWVAYKPDGTNLLPSGTYNFTYSTEWKLNNTAVDLADYGITVTNTPIAGDVITVVFVREVRGTITVALPHAEAANDKRALVATGWNLYDHTNGYARCVKYSNVYGYAISGTYTSLEYAETPTGTTTEITPNEDGLFDVPGDGYILVTGGNGTDTAIWCTWSDADENFPGGGSWEAYSESKIEIGGIMRAALPYGLCKIGSGSSAVYDEIDFVHKQIISRISRVAYSEEARATAAASGRAYSFDENYIYQERATESVSSFTLDDEYQVHEYGLEFFAGSEIEVGTQILYGQNLKDKLKRDVVTISEQTLTNGQKAQVRENIGAAGAAETTQNIEKLSDAVCYVVDKNKSAEEATIPVGSIVRLKNSTIAGRADGIYTVKTAIPVNTVLDNTYFNENSPIDGGLAGYFNGKLTTTESSITLETQSNYSLITAGVQNKVMKYGNVVQVSMILQCDTPYGNSPGVLILKNIPKTAASGYSFWTFLPAWFNRSDAESIRISLGDNGCLYARGGTAGKAYDINIAYITS